MEKIQEKKNEKIIKNPEVILDLFSQIHHSFPGAVRVPYRIVKHKLFFTYNILDKLGDEIVLYLADVGDADRASTATIDWQEGKIHLFSQLAKNMVKFQLYKNQLRRYTDKKTIDQIIYRVRANYGYQGSFASSSYFPKKVLFSQKFPDIIVISPPSEVFFPPQRRSIERWAVPSEKNILVTVYPAEKDERIILQAKSVPVKDKVLLRRLWNHVKPATEDFTEILKIFFSLTPPCIFSPYFEIEKLYSASFLDYLKGRGILKESERWFGPRKENQREIIWGNNFILPVKIYKNYGGHFIFLNCPVDRREFCRLFVYLFSYILEQHPAFNLYTRSGGRLVNLSNRGIYFISKFMNHAQIYRDLKIICEFLLEPSAPPIKIGVQVTEMTQPYSQRHEYHIRGKFVSMPWSSSKTLHRIDKFLNDYMILSL